MVGMPFFIFVSHFLQKHLVVSNSVRTFESTKKHKVFIHNQNQIKMKKPMKIIYLEREVFEHDLQYHLTIINYPEKGKPFYVCEYDAPYSRTKKIKIHIID